MEQPIHCERCGTLLTGEIVWLELDTRDNQYKVSVPAEHSQGGFPFGVDCARAIRDNAT